MKNATFRQLRVFSTVAKTLSFIRAAEQLHLTPPAITMQIKELEGHIGLPLFDRSGRKISLTTTGEYMLVYARKILATLKDAEDAAARFQRIETGVLTIGFVSTATYFLLQHIASFKQSHAGIEVQIVTGNREQLVKVLEEGEVDIAIMGRPPKELRIRAEPFAAHPHVFVAPPHHPLAGQSSLAPDTLAHYDFIVREQGSGTRAAMEKFFTDHRVEPNLAMRVTSNETHKQAVMAGLGLGFVSLHTIGFELEHKMIAVLDVKGAPVVRAWNVVHTLAKVLSPAAEAFRYFMLEQGEASLAEHFGKYWALDASAADMKTA